MCTFRQKHFRVYKRDVSRVHKRAARRVYKRGPGLCDAATAQLTTATGSKGEDETLLLAREPCSISPIWINNKSAINIDCIYIYCYTKKQLQLVKHIKHIMVSTWLAIGLLARSQ